MTKIDFTKLSVHGSAKESPGFLLWRASTLWRRLMERTLANFDLTHPQFVLLAAVAWLTREGEQTTQIAVARHAELDPNTTSQVLRSLQAKGLIDRVQLSDERSKSPILTDKGARLLRKALPAVEQADASFFEQVNLKTVTAMKALQKLAHYE